MTVNLNQVAITGKLTHEPSLVTLRSGHVLCELQLASHHHERDEITGEWREWAECFTVRASGFQARAAHRGLSKGSSVAVAGRLSSRRVSADDGSSRREVEIVAQTIQFLARARRG